MRMPILRRWTWTAEHFSHQPSSLGNILFAEVSARHRFWTAKGARKDLERYRQATVTNWFARVSPYTYGLRNEKVFRFGDEPVQREKVT